MNEERDVREIKILALKSNGIAANKQDICSFTHDDEAVDIAKGLIEGLHNVLEDSGFSPFKIQQIRVFARHYLEVADRNSLGVQKAGSGVKL